MFSLDAILGLLLAHKYAIIFPIAVIEGPMISVLSGLLASNHLLNAPLAYGLLLFADIVGDAVYYAMGYWGGNAFFHKWGRWFGVKEERLLQMENEFNKHGGKWLLFGKTQPYGVVILAAAGVLRMNFFRYIAINAAASFFKVLMFFLLGYFFGEAYNRIDDLLGKIGLVSLVASGIFVVFYLLRKNRP